MRHLCFTKSAENLVKYSAKTVITETFTMSMFLDMANSIRIWNFFCVCVWHLQLCIPAWETQEAVTATGKKSETGVHTPRSCKNHLHCIKKNVLWDMEICKICSSICKRCQRSCRRWNSGWCVREAARGTGWNIDYLMLNCKPEMLKQHVCRAVFSKLGLRPKWLLFLLRNGLNLKFQH